MVSEAAILPIRRTWRWSLLKGSMRNVGPEGYGVVVFAGGRCRGVNPQEGHPHAFHFVGGNLLTVAGAAQNGSQGLRS